MTLEFDPNNPAKQKPRPVWATYIPGRRGAAFKQHSDRGKALNAFHYRTQGILYHWEDEQWVEVYKMEEMPRDCARCGNLNTHGGTTTWIGKPSLRRVKLCRNCEPQVLYPDGDKWLHKFKIEDRSIEL